MGVAIFSGKWTIGPRNVLAILWDLVREVREVRDLVRTGRCQAKVGMVRVGMVRVFGKGKGGNGKGFGYQGTCSNCQQVGHKAAECMNARVAQVAEELGTEELIGSVEVGGMGNGNMWYVCSVEGEVTDKPLLPVVVRNRFSCLTEEDEDAELKCQPCNAWPVEGEVSNSAESLKGKVSNPLSH